MAVPGKSINCLFFARRLFSLYLGQEVWVDGLATRKGFFLVVYVGNKGTAPSLQWVGENGGAKVSGGSTFGVQLSIS